MSSPLLQANITLLNNVLINSDDPYYSDSFDLSETGSYAVQLTYVRVSGSLSFIIQGSNDDVNFSDMDTTTLVASGSAMVEFPNVHYTYVRIAAQRVTGTSHVTAILACK